MPRETEHNIYYQTLRQGAGSPHYVMRVFGRGRILGFGAESYVLALRAARHLLAQ